MSNDRTAEILKYLSAMSHDIGDFRAEMNKRIDETNTRIDELRAEMNARFLEVNTRFDKAEREQRQVMQKLLRIERQFDVRKRHRTGAQASRLP